MKSTRIFLLVLFFASSVLQASTYSPESNESCTASEAYGTMEGILVDDVIVALSEYTSLTEYYIHEHLDSFISLGYNAASEEYGTISVETDDGIATWNWRDGGSNVIVVWPM